MSRPVVRMVSVGRLRMPLVVAVVLGLTLLASVVGAIGQRNGLPLATWGALFPSRVMAGEAWRLVTWIFLDVDPIALLFACLLLYWFGRDLCLRWGSVRFLVVYLGLGVLAGGVTTALALAWPDVRAAAYLGSSAVMGALVIAWATHFPDREINLYFVVRVSGRTLILLTIGATAFFAIFSGLAAFLPNFIAEGTMLIALGQLRRLVVRRKARHLQVVNARYLANVARVDRDEDEKGPPPAKPPRWLN